MIKEKITKEKRLSFEECLNVMQELKGGRK